MSHIDAALTIDDVWRDIHMKHVLPLESLEIELSEQIGSSRHNTPAVRFLTALQEAVNALAEADAIAAEIDDGFRGAKLDHKVGIYKRPHGPEFDDIDPLDRAEGWR